MFRVRAARRFGVAALGFFIACAIPHTLAQAPKRLTIIGQSVLDDHLVPIRLRGANVDAPTAAQAADLKTNLQMNFVRLRISFEPPNIELGQPGNLTATYRANITTWISNLTSQGIWVNLEGRTDDAHANDINFYRTNTSNFAEYREFWRYLASTYKTNDYIAAYGLLAEPSPDRGKNYEPYATNEPVHTLTVFQHALMDTISAPTNSEGAGDTNTPFIVGPAFNYDTLQYRYPGYFTNLAAYSNRLIYAVNFLTPKPWIKAGTNSAGEAISYPQPPLQDFDALINDDPNTSADDKQPPELRFNDRLDFPTNQAAALSPEFIAWYLGHALEFSEMFRVPMYVDQFGASALATNASHLRYEQDVIAYAETQGWHWTRWSYNLGNDSRTIVDNPVTRTFYESNLPALMQRDHELVITPLANQSVQLEWAGRVLQTSMDLSDWHDVPGVPSPLETNIVAAPQRFWRLRSP